MNFNDWLNKDNNEFIFICVVFALALIIFIIAFNFYKRKKRKTLFNDFSMQNEYFENKLLKLIEVEYDDTLKYDDSNLLIGTKNSNRNKDKMIKKEFDSLEDYEITNSKIKVKGDNCEKETTIDEMRKLFYNFRNNKFHYQKFEYISLIVELTWYHNIYQILNSNKENDDFKIIIQDLQIKFENQYDDLRVLFQKLFNTNVLTFNTKTYNFLKAEKNKSIKGVNSQESKINEILQGNKKYTLHRLLEYFTKAKLYKKEIKQAIYLNNNLNEDDNTLNITLVRETFDQINYEDRYQSRFLFIIIYNFYNKRLDFDNDELLLLFNKLLLKKLKW